MAGTEYPPLPSGMVAVMEIPHEGGEYTIWTDEDAEDATLLIRVLLGLSGPGEEG